MAFLLAQLAVLIFLSLAAHATDLSSILATRIKIQSSSSIPPGVGITPTFADFKGRTLREQLLQGAAGPGSRHLLDTPVNTQDYGSPVSVPPGFNSRVLDPICGNATSGGFKLLTTSPSLIFYATMKKDIVTGAANVVFVFNQDAHDYFSIVTKSGSDYGFLRGVIVLPDELSATEAPPYYVSPSDFLGPDPSKPVLVKLNTKGPVDTVPSIGLRFDYISTAPGYTPLFSLYLSSLEADYPKGLPQADLEVSTLAPSLTSDTVAERINAGK